MSAMPPPLPIGKRPSPRRQPTVGRYFGAAKTTPTVVSCKNCAGSVKVRDDKGTVLVVCEYCGCAMDVGTPGAAQKIAIYKREQLPAPLSIGDEGKISGHTFTVIGRVRYSQSEEGLTYTWDEFQLYNPRHGYIFLSLEDGHWAIYRGKKISRSLPNPKTLSERDTFLFEGVQYRVHEAGGVARISYVEGELSWIARKGDRISFTEAIAPPNSMAAEWTENEIEWFYGRYQTRAQVAQAFGKDINTLPATQGVASMQVFQRSPAQTTMLYAGLVGAALCIVMSLFAASKTGTVVLREEISYAAYISEDGGTTGIFSVPAGHHIYQLVVEAPVRNAWVAASIAILDEEDAVVFDAESTSEYYAGRDSEGAWAEGSTRDTTLFRLTGPGKFKLNVFGSTGGWTGGDSQPQFEVPLVIHVVEGVMPVRYFLLALILAALYPAKEIGRQWMFHSRKWPSDNDD